MPVPWSVFITLALAAAGYVAARRRALASAGGNTRRMHSLSGAYGTTALIWTAVPALLILGLGS